MRHALAARRLPLWSDALEGGSSPWVNPQSGTLSPIAFLARPLPIQHHLTAAHVLKMTIALEGRVAARERGSAPAGSRRRSVESRVALSGGIQAWALLPPSAVAAWAPWVAVALIGVASDHGRAASRSARSLVGCLALSGNPEVAAFAIAFARGVGAAPRPPELDARALGSLALVIVAGTALAAPVLAPFSRSLPAAQRLEELGYSRVPLETLDLSPRTWFLASRCTAPARAARCADLRPPVQRSLPGHAQLGGGERRLCRA